MFRNLKLDIFKHEILNVAGSHPVNDMNTDIDRARVGQSGPEQH